MKLQKAKERRDEMDRIRQITLHDKNEQAHQRAKENIECKRERMRKKISRVAKVKARHSMMEEKNRKVALASIEHKLNGALSRAEENIKKKQIKARNRKRAERAEKKREILEFERRSILLSTVDRRTELAQKKVESMLKDRQCKARESVEHAHHVSRRVRAARVLQRAVRALTWSTEEEPEVKSVDNDTAAIRLQCWAPWRVNVACSRLLSTSEGSPAPLEYLKLLLSEMGHSSSTSRTSTLSFEELCERMSKNENIFAAKKFICSFRPMLGVEVSSWSKPFLSLFLITQQPLAVLGPKRDDELSSRLLENAGRKLLQSIMDISNLQCLNNDQKQYADLVAQTASRLLSYCTLFEKWKKADVDNLVKEMATCATRSFVACISSREAMTYAEEKTNDESKEHGDPLYQHKLRHKSTRRGANSHIKRIRASMEKLLGPEESLAILKAAKRVALTQVKENDLIEKAKSEMDAAFVTHSEKVKSEEADAQIDINDAAALDDVNEHVVHEILLADNEDIRDRLCKNPDASIIDCVESFMDKFKNDIPSAEEAVTVDSFTFTMEKAFADNMIENWNSKNDMVGVVEMLTDILQKMRNLVPNSKKIHSLFEDCLASQCKDAADILLLLARVADVMSSSLESEYRAASTLQWLNATRTFGRTHAVPFQFSDIHSYVVFSMLFLLKKLDICHADLVNFKLMRVTPMIRQNGVSYERQCFHTKHPATEELHGTRNWVKRMDLSLADSCSNLNSVLKNGFVDELLFVRERISMPEVLCLDAARISSIRERAQRAVICSSLFLHACNLVRRRVSFLNESEAIKSKVEFHKNEIMKSLKNNLPFETLFQAVSIAIVTFTEGTCTPTCLLYLNVPLFHDRFLHKNTFTIQLLASKTSWMIPPLKGFFRILNQF